MWENSIPHNHYKVPSSADVHVDAANPRLDFRPVRGYNFANRDLLEYVGDRMLMYARTAIAYPGVSIDAIRNVDAGEWIWKDTPCLDYRVAQLQVAFNADNAADMDRVRAELNSVPYSMTDLKKDLREITEVFRAARR